MKEWIVFKRLSNQIRKRKRRENKTLWTKRLRTLESLTMKWNTKIRNERSYKTVRGRKLGLVKASRIEMDCIVHKVHDGKSLDNGEMRHFHTNTIGLQLTWITWQHIHE